tara:strand:+ start:252 stop:866 length:615 start_codon:yes stop_codon:yes gene_type:complete
MHPAQLAAAVAATGNPRGRSGYNTWNRGPTKKDQSIMEGPTNQEMEVLRRRHRQAEQEEWNNSYKWKNVTLPTGIGGKHVMDNRDEYGNKIWPPHESDKYYRHGYPISREYQQAPWKDRKNDFPDSYEHKGDGPLGMESPLGHDFWKDPKTGYVHKNALDFHEWWIMEKVAKAEAHLDKVPRKNIYNLDGTIYRRPIPPDGPWK